MSQNERYYLIYNYKKIHSEFKSHLNQKIYVDSHINNYVQNSMNEFSDEELEVMRESTLKYKERNSLEATVGISALTAIFTLFAILVAISESNGVEVIFIILGFYALMVGCMTTYIFKKDTQIIRTANLLDIAIRLRKQKNYC